MVRLGGHRYFPPAGVNSCAAAVRRSITPAVTHSRATRTALTIAVADDAPC
jgi:hypothetical protein